jgi:hypothetical protein
LGVAVKVLHADRHKVVNNHAIGCGMQISVQVVNNHAAVGSGRGGGRLMDGGRGGG